MNTDKIILEGYVWKSQQNGGVYNPNGISPTITCGQHSGCEPKILECDMQDNLKLFISRNPQKNYGYGFEWGEIAPTILASDFKSPPLVLKLYEGD